MNEINWKSFNIGGKNGLFTVESSNSGIDKKKLISLSGETPYITRTNLNNGINLFVGDDQKPQYKKNEGNAITIALDTQTVFYQEKPFFTGQNIQVLYHEKLTKNIALFIIPLLEIQMKKFNWGGNGATLTRLNKTKIMLPSTYQGNPHWSYMENYIKNLKIKAYNKAKHFLRKELNKLDTFERVSMKEKKWGHFSIESIAIIKSGKDWPKSKRKSGNVPFIGSSAQANAITDFVEPSIKSRSVDKNVISINRNGSVGYAFFHPYEAYFSGDTRFIKLRKHTENEYINLFISRCITNQKDKYAYGYKMGSKRIKKQQITLPINQEGNIDYDFMENYIKQIKKEKLEKLLYFLD